jgi:DNA-binding NarL/FixJ family response regulator
MEDGVAAKLTCLLVDDHPAILSALTRYLAEEGINVVAQASYGAEAIAVIARRNATVALVDLRLPDMSGIEVVRALDRSGIACVLYTGFADLQQARKALDSGARGVISKDAPLADIARALAVVAAGGVYLDPLLGGQLAAPTERDRGLTKREREILRLLADGMTNEEVGARLFLSPETVRTHVRKAVGRLGARNRVQAVAVALKEQAI